MYIHIYICIHIILSYHIILYYVYILYIYHIFIIIYQSNFYFCICNVLYFKCPICGTGIPHYIKLWVSLTVHATLFVSHCCISSFQTPSARQRLLSLLSDPPSNNKEQHDAAAPFIVRVQSLGTAQACGPIPPPQKKGGHGYI